ncbi:MAG: lasso peptide biosynthesis B2 protein [Cyanobacteria bacterium]|nr:lasso peptide biosynthesis B2 protein [Cyanobacteriota bacterium]
MSVTAVALKPGVLFVQTASGATLMDIPSDRFIALSSTSAMIWRFLALGLPMTEVIGNVSRNQGVDFKTAEALLLSQVRLWQQAELINVPQRPGPLPVAKVSSTAPASREVAMDAIQSSPLDPRLLVSLWIAEAKYRRALSRVGFANTLVAFQSEVGHSAGQDDAALQRTLRSYHASRRLFRQGNESRDCLVRSLALAAVLRRHGLSADLCIGIVDMPFRSHAWVEADGCIVNDRCRACARYKVISRF